MSEAATVVDRQVVKMVRSQGFVLTVINMNGSAFISIHKAKYAPFLIKASVANNDTAFESCWAKLGRHFGQRYPARRTLRSLITESANLTLPTT